MIATVIKGLKEMAREWTVGAGAGACVDVGVSNPNVPCHRERER